MVKWFCIFVFEFFVREHAFSTFSRELQKHTKRRSKVNNNTILLGKSGTTHSLFLLFARIQTMGLRKHKSKARAPNRQLILQMKKKTSSNSLFYTTLH